MADGQPALPGQPGIDVDPAELGRQRTARFGDDLLQGTERDELVLLDVRHPRLGDGVVGQRIRAEHHSAALPGDEFGEATPQPGAQMARDPAERVDEGQPPRAARPGRSQGEAGTIGRIKIVEATAQNIGSQPECRECS